VLYSGRYTNYKVLEKDFYEQLKLAELGQGDWPMVPENLPFTPRGWKIVMDKLEAPYLDEEFESLYKE
jgi:hypothetical protein